MTKEMMNYLKEILETLVDCTVEEIEEFRQEWISALTDPFKKFNIQFANQVCDIAIDRLAA